MNLRGALLLAALAAAPSLTPFLFPICAGFALLGPLTSLWFAALSRARELNGTATAEAAAAVFDTPRRITIQRLGLLIVALFLAWIATAGLIYQHTLGQSGQAGGLSFFAAVFASPAGWSMLRIGCLVGFCFAITVLGVGFIAFPLALDRDVSVTQACGASLRVLFGSPLVVLAWGALVAGLLAIGIVPVLLGLALVLPVLGHASWHIYRAVTS